MCSPAHDEARTSGFPPGPDAVVALFEKSAADAAVLKSWSEAKFTKTVAPWIEVTEHSGEHDGLLVAYYRANGRVPPESRPKK